MKERPAPASPTGRYRPISVRMWGDDRFSRLSRPQPNGQTLWIYLLTGPHTTALPGAFVAGEAALAEALGWSLAAFRKVFSEVFGEGMVEVDSRTRLIYLPKAVRHNPPQSPNVVIAWRKAFDELPDSALKVRIFVGVIGELKRQGFGEAFIKAFGEAYVEENENLRRIRTGTRTVPEQEQKGEGKEGAAAPARNPFGEFGRALLSVDEERKLRTELGEHFETYVADFDRWVEEAPDAKDRSGVKRRDRKPYNSILAWYSRDKKQGHLKPPGGKLGRPTRIEQNRNAVEEFVRGGPELSGRGNGEHDQSGNPRSLPDRVG